jgi:hypothetical protein
MMESVSYVYLRQRNVCELVFAYACLHGKYSLQRAPNCSRLEMASAYFESCSRTPQQ